MLKATSFGLNAEPLGYLKEGLSLAFGSGNVEIEEVPTQGAKPQIRHALKSSNVVAVVLDKESLPGLEGLDLTDSKVLLWETDFQFVELFNKVFNTKLNPPDNLDGGVSEEEVSEDIWGTTSEGTPTKTETAPETSALLLQLSSKDSIIANLKAQLASMSEELNSLVLDKPEFSGSTGELELRRKIENLENSEHSDRAFEEVKRRLTETEERFALQAGLLRDKERKLTDSETSLKETQETLWEVKNALAEKNGEIEVLERRVSSAKVQEASLRAELSGVVSSEQKRAELEEQVATLTLEKNSAEELISGLGAAKQVLESKVQNLESVVSALRAAEEEKDKLIQELNEIQISLRTTIREKEALIPSYEAGENSDILTEYAQMKSNILTKIGQNVSPNGSTNVKLLEGSVPNNIVAVFSGGAQSRRSKYRYLSEKLRRFYASASNPTLGNPKDLEIFPGFDPTRQTLIIDAVTESFADYVFEIREVVKGVGWFERGGSVQNYLSKTYMREVKVIHPGLGYLNEAYLLSVDWTSRLLELGKSGYNVVIIGGDIQNLVGRVLFESFQGFSQVQIISQGQTTSLRNLIVSLRGLKSGNNLEIILFEVGSTSQRFVEIISKRHKVFYEDRDWGRV